MIDWSTVSGVADLYQLVKDIFRSTSSHNAQTSPMLTTPPPQEQVERYKTGLGRRCEFLREVLKLNPRQMADFCGFEKTDYLHDCEAGLDEFPTAAINKLVQVFFIRLEYLQEGKDHIFQDFDIVSTKKDCHRFLEQGFRPYFLCSPNFEEYGDAYLVFWKQDEGYWRMITSNYVGNFYSSGGGANNIYNLIDSMLDLHIRPSWSNISFLNVCPEEWDLLEKGCWYNKEMRGYVGAANYQARDIFESWFEKAQETRKRWAS